VPLDSPSLAFLPGICFTLTDKHFNPAYLNHTDTIRRVHSHGKAYPLLQVRLRLSQNAVAWLSIAILFQHLYQNSKFFTCLPSFRLLTTFLAREWCETIPGSLFGGRVFSGSNCLRRERASKEETEQAMPCLRGSARGGSFRSASSAHDAADQGKGRASKLREGPE
jgi:hypothetical protein